MAMGEQHNHQRVELEPGFRFHPTDEEIITHYLTHKAFNKRFSTIAIGEIDINKFEPWELPGKAKMGEMEWYFYCQMDQKYPTGTRVNRATRAGFWKATGKDKEIYHGATRVLIGKKKTLVFYKGRAHNDEKTNWVMHEYHLDNRFQYPNNQNPITPTKDEWVVSKIFQKISRVKNVAMPIANADASRSLSMSIGEEDFVGGSNSLPSLMHPSYCTTTSVIDTSATLEMGQIWNASPLLHNPLLQTMFNHEVNNIGSTHNQENVGSTHNQEGPVQTTTLDMTEQLSNITSGWGLPLTVLGTDLHAATGNISSMTSSAAAVNLDVDGTWKY